MYWGLRYKAQSGVHAASVYSAMRCSIIRISVTQVSIRSCHMCSSHAMHVCIPRNRRYSARRCRDLLWHLRFANDLAPSAVDMVFVLMYFYGA